MACTSAGVSPARLRPSTMSCLRSARPAGAAGEQRGLAGAARPGQEDELPLVDAERQIAQRVDAAAIESWLRSRLRSIIPVSFLRAVHQRRIRLAPRRLHHLADQEPEGLLLARRDTAGDGFWLRERRRRRRQRRSPRPRRRCGQALGGDDLGGGRRTYIFSKTLFGDRSADRARVDEPDQARERLGREAARSSIPGPTSFIFRVSSPMIQLLAALGCPPAAAVASK